MSRPVDRRWKVQSRHSEMRRQPWLEVFKETIELPDGRLVDDSYSLDMQDFVVVVAVTGVGEVVVESHYRHGPRKVTWSLPAGYVHLGESGNYPTTVETLLQLSCGNDRSEEPKTGRVVGIAILPDGVQSRVSGRRHLP